MQRLPPHLKDYLLEETKLQRYPLRIAVLPELLDKTHFLGPQLDASPPYYYDYPAGYRIKYGYAKFMYITHVRGFQPEGSKHWMIWRISPY